MQTPRDVVKYRNDSNQSGFGFEGNIFKRTISSAFFLESSRTGIILKIEEIFYFLIEVVKDLKKMSSWQQPMSNKNMN